MATIKLSQDDAQFLRDLQHELLTQPNDGNADPVYWGVIETREEPAPEDCGEARIYNYDGYFVQVLQEGFFTDKWVDVKGFGDRESAEKLLKALE